VSGQPDHTETERLVEQDVGLLVRALGQRLPRPDGISDLDALEAATRIKAALVAASTELADTKRERDEARGERDRSREWVRRLWATAEQELWDERHGPGDWALRIQRTYSDRAVAAESALRDVQQQVATLREALERYGEHDRACNYVAQPFLGVCACGYNAALVPPPSEPGTGENMSDEKQMLADALRVYPTWGHAYLAERKRADALAAVVRDAWGSLLAFYTDIPEAEVQRLVASCESVNDHIEARP
jgi:hypothetical protein